MLKDSNLIDSKIPEYNIIRNLTNVSCIVNKIMKDPMSIMFKNYDEYYLMIPNQYLSDILQYVNDNSTIIKHFTPNYHVPLFLKFKLNRPVSVLSLNTNTIRKLKKINIISSIEKPVDKIDSESTKIEINIETSSETSFCSDCEEDDYGIYNFLCL